MRLHRLLLVPIFASMSTLAYAQGPSDPTAAGAPAAPATQGPTFGNVGKVEEAEKPTGTHWYGWQTLSVDGAVLVAGLLPITTSDKSINTALVSGWYSAYSLGTPIVHWAHGHMGKGFASLGMRLVGPFAGAILGAGVGLAAGADFGATNGHGDALYVSTGDRLIQAGAILGIIAPMVIDAAFLAREPEKERSPSGGLQLTGGPTLLRGGGGFSGGGTF
jgi:hypothetical protein